MPDVVDYMVSIGYLKDDVNTYVSVLAADDAGWRRHPPAGRAVRLEPR